MPNTLEPETWDMLIDRLKNGRCTPFLGAGASYPSLPLGSDIARDWARDYGYPLNNPDNLVEVAQYLAVQRDPLFPKEQILKRIESAPAPDFRVADEPHNLLAALPIAI
jgi:hypothetical protein